MTRQQEALEAFAFDPFTLEFTRPAHGFGLLPSALLRGFLVRLTEFHFAKDAFSLHLLFQGFQRLIDIIIAYDDLYQGSSPSSKIVC